MVGVEFIFLTESAGLLDSKKCAEEGLVWLCYSCDIYIFNIHMFVVCFSSDGGVRMKISLHKNLVFFALSKLAVKTDSLDAKHLIPHITRSTKIES